MSVALPVDQLLKSPHTVHQVSAHTVSIMRLDLLTCCLFLCHILCHGHCVGLPYVTLSQDARHTLGIDRDYIASAMTPNRFSKILRFYRSSTSPQRYSHLKPPGAVRSRSRQRSMITCSPTSGTSAIRLPQWAQASTTRLSSKHSVSADFNFNRQPHRQSQPSHAPRHHTHTILPQDINV